MKSLIRAAAAMVLAVALTGCFLVPGQFGSTLDLRKDGHFAFTYTGEMILQAPDKFGKKPVWNEKGAHCYTDKTSDPYYSEMDASSSEDAASGRADDERACTAAEIAGLKKTWDSEQLEKAQKDAKEGERFAQMFGFNPMDDASMQKFAVQLGKQAGWKSVTYAGKGKFNVDYAVDGTLDHDFAFPLIGDAQMIMPFIMIQRRTDGGAMVTAPAFSASLLGGLGNGMGELIGGGMSEQKADQPSGAKGQFSITTNAEILTNNTAEGPVMMGKDRKLVWEVGAIKDPAPKALIMVKVGKN